MEKNQENRMQICTAKYKKIIEIQNFNLTEKERCASRAQMKYSKGREGKIRFKNKSKSEMSERNDLILFHPSESLRCLKIKA